MCFSRDKLCPDRLVRMALSHNTIRQQQSMCFLGYIIVFFDIRKNYLIYFEILVVCNGYVISLEYSERVRTDKGKQI
ncbi:hypothetical protein SDC9_193203 [bioreactor metagenome]|uniref:Uncharacterized protein n=1 Tax=bioreactor metagenome TaxID=1076179 RepID=A0A645I2X4_9ZZZZ